MRYSRTGIVAVLVAAEIFIGGAILWFVRGGHGWSAQASGLHQVSEHGMTFDPIDAGSSPHVSIDDPDSRIVVTPSNDGKVHVSDGWSASGWMFGPPKDVPLNVSRTADGVAISRGSGGFHIGFFISDTERTNVALPPGARLDIRRCAGADVSGLTGAVAVRSVDGAIHLSGIRAQALQVSSSDGDLRFEDVQAPSIDASTNDGSISASDLRVGGGTIRSLDGGIRLALADANVTVHARTQDGSVRFNGNSVHSEDDSAGGDYRVGTGSGSLQVSTSDGSIHIYTNGAI